MVSKDWAHQKLGWQKLGWQKLGWQKYLIS